LGDDQLIISGNSRKQAVGIKKTTITIILLFPGSKDLIGKLLRKRPEDRLPLKDVLQHAWITSGGGGQH
jgi:hypothetical protein